MPSRFSSKTISLSFGILVFLFSLVFIAFAWTEPTLLPPSGNADAPLNVGTTAQTKNARLSVTELYDANDSTYYLNPNGQSVLSGPLGIGTTGPITQLHIPGNVPASAVGSVATGANPRSVYVQGRYAYVVSSGASTLQVFDVSNPASPVSVGSVATIANPTSVYVQGKYAYIVNYGAPKSLQVIDISNPASPAAKGSVAIPGEAWSVYVQGRYAYAANMGTNTLLIIDVSDPSSPALITSFATGTTWPAAVYVQGRYAYVPSSGAFQVIDVSDPSSPAITGSVAVTGRSYAVYVQGRYAYLFNNSGNTLQIIDVSNPASPVSVGSVATDSGPYSVYAQGRYVFLADSGANTLQIFDVSNPASPVSVGSVSTGAASLPRSVFVQGRYAFVATVSGNNLQIFDIGGAYVQQIEAGGVETGTLSTRSNLQVGNDLDVKGGLQVGRGIAAAGPFSVYGGAAGSMFVIDATGNVGIKTSSPTTALDLNGALSIRAIAAPSVSPVSQGRIYFDSTANKFKVSENGGTYIDLLSASGLTGSGSSGQAAFFTGASALSGDNGFFWDNTNKRLGIGTTGPNSKLEIQGVRGVNNQGQLYVKGISDHAYIMVGTDSPATKEQGFQIVGQGTIASPDWSTDYVVPSINRNLRIANGKIVVDYTTGNVGIGTTSPTNKLSVGDDITAFAGGNAIVMGKTTANSAIGVGQSGTDFLSMQWNYNATPANAYAEFYSGNHNIVFTPGTGKIGIGTTSPGMKLDILPGTGTETAFRIQSSGGTSDNFYIGQWGGTGSNWNLGGQNAGAMNLYINRNAGSGDVIIGATNGGANSRVLMIQGSTGNVGIGTTTPSSKLTVAGTIESTGFKLTTSPSAGYVLTSDASGGGTWQAAAGVPSGTSITTTSPYPPSGYTYTGNFTAVQPDSNDDGDYWTSKTAVTTARRDLAVVAVNNKIYAIGGYAVGGGSTGANEEYDPTSNSWIGKTSMTTSRGGVAAAVANGKIYVIGGSGAGQSYRGTNEEYDPIAGTWAAKTSMPTGREGASAATVNNKIYVFGGFTGTNGALNTNEEYDPAVGVGGTWTSKIVMPSGRAYPTAATVGNRIYVIGGGMSSTINEEYNPATNTWATKTAMPTGRSTASAVSVFDRVYVVGGYNGSVLSANEEYDPARDSWTVRASLPTARGSLAAAAVGNRIYAVGGANSLSTTIAINEEYKVVVANVWAAKTVLPTARHSPAVAVVNNKLYAIGGNNGIVQVGTNEEYNPATNSWATKTAMPTVREQAAATAVNGIIYVVGGWNGSPITNNEAYNPLADTWTGKAGMQARRYGLAAVTVRDKIYAIGGATWCGPYNDWCGTGANEEYNPYTNAWVYKTGVPGSFSCQASQANLAAAVANNKIYAVGGDGGAFANPNTCIQGFNNEYDPLFDTWTVKTGMRYARKYLAAASVNNKIYAIGGWNNGTRYDQMEEYDPVTNTWTNKKSMSSQRYLLGAGVVYNKIYAVGGYTTNVLNNNDEYTPPSTFYYIHTKN